MSNGQLVQASGSAIVPPTLLGSAAAGDALNLVQAWLAGGSPPLQGATSQPFNISINGAVSNAGGASDAGAVTGAVAADFITYYGGIPYHIGAPDYRSRSCHFLSNSFYSDPWQRLRQ